MTVLNDLTYISTTPTYFKTISNLPNYLIGAFIFTEIKTCAEIMHVFLKNFYADYFVNNSHNAHNDLYLLSQLDYTSIDTYRYWFLIIFYGLAILDDRADTSNLMIQFIACSTSAIDEYINTINIPQIDFYITISIDMTVKTINIGLFCTAMIIFFDKLKNILSYKYDNGNILIKVTLFNSYLSKVYKFPIECAFLFVIFILFYIVNTMLCNEMIIDILNSWNYFGLVIYFVCFVIYLIRYNINFFSFLELSNVETSNYKYIAKQYLRDCTNIVAHILRLLLLFLRLNIYDGLDDIFDSYYVFIGDFNIYEYYDFAVLYFVHNWFLVDNTYDLSITKYTESSYNTSSIYIYTAILYKIFLFLFFLTEGVLRIFLATYIILLLSLEINNFNVIYAEDANSNLK